MYHFSKLKRGFSLPELMVSIGIIAVIMTVVLRSQSDYTDVAALRNSADDMALSITQAQTYGLGVREVSTGSNDFSASYGLSLNLVSGSNKEYISFADRGTKNKIYDDSWTCPIGGSSECIEKTNITNGNTITGLCYFDSSGIPDCAMGRIDITFTRPDPKADFTLYNQGGAQQIIPSTVGIKIILTSPKNHTKSIFVYKTGQVSVQ